MSEFKFKQFSVIDSDCTMRVGTDAVLIGAWTNVESAKNVLDIGTGSGVIALMLAQRCNAKIIGIDIDQLSIDKAIINFQNSPWSDRLEARCTSLQEFKTDSSKYDVIISNPPFFVDSLNSPNARKNNARHTNSLPFEDLLKSVSYLLSEDGIFSVVIPIQYYEQFNIIAMQQNLYNVEKCIVHPNYVKPPKRLLLKYSKNLMACKHDELFIEQNNRFEYTDKYISLTKSYYLFM